MRRIAGAAAIDWRAGSAAGAFDLQRYIDLSGRRCDDAQPLGQVGAAEAMTARIDDEECSGLVGTYREGLPTVFQKRSLFEPVRPLPLAAAQDYLLTRTRDLTLHEIVTWLEPVRDQIAGLEDREVRLILQLFAEYLRDRHCSPRDRRRLLVQIVNWLATDEELSSALQARFFEYWSQASHLADAPPR